MRMRINFSLLFLLPVVTFCVTSGAIADENNLCIGTLATAPTFDGVITGDPGWTGVVPVKMRQDGATSEATMYLGRHSGSLYVGFQIGIPLASSSNTIILVFSPHEDAAAVQTNAWRIALKVFSGIDPTVTGDFSGQPLADGAANYWRHGGTPATTLDVATGWDADADPGSGALWLTGSASPNIRRALNGSQWSVELRVPLVSASLASTDDGIFLPDSPSSFRMHANVFSTLLSAVASVQDAWPAKERICVTANPCLGDDELLHNTPAPGRWGVASFFSRPACADITLNWWDIGVLSPDDGISILDKFRRGAFTGSSCASASGSLGPDNKFVARPKNTGAFDANVTAVFNISQFGIGPAFIPIPAGTSTDTDAVPAGGTKDLTVDWNLTPKQSCEFAPPNDHQCLRVALTADAPLETPSVQRNMRVVQASKFTGTAVVSGAQGPLPGGANKHRFLILVDTDQQNGFASTTPTNASALASTNNKPPKTSAAEHFRSNELANLIQPQANMSFGSWVARGYVYTNNTVTIDGKRFTIVDKAGDFGYIARHDSAKADWSYSFTGPGLTAAVDGSSYTIDLAPHEEAIVQTTIEATEPGSISSGHSRYRFFFDIGPNFPNSGFSNLVDGRWSANAGIEKILRPNWSLEAIAGHHYFDGEAEDRFHFCLNIEQFAVNVKRYFGPGPIHWFMNGGGGVYYVDPPEDWNWGVNAGAGVLYDINSRWGIEGAYNYHRVNFNPDDLGWSTLQAGLRISF